MATNQKSIGFVGGGRVTRILLAGWQQARALPANIVVSDPNPETRAKLKAKIPAIITAADNTAAAAQDVVFVAVHPPLLADVVTGIRPAVRASAILVSLAPKFTIAKLTGLLGGFGRIARVIPNAPSLIGQGYNPVAFAAGLSDIDRVVVTGLLQPLGECPVVAEEKLEGYALLTGMGPTYFWFQLQALREVAAGCGLTEEEIKPALKRMICGGTRTLLEAGLSPAEVMDLIPVKPLGGDEPAILNLYRTKLPGLYEKIRPGA